MKLPTLGKRSSSPAQIDINTMEQNDKPWSCHSCETSSNPKETSVLDVNSVDHKKTHRSWKCIGCGGTQFHPRPSCPAYKVNCHKCRRSGHFAKVCRQIKSVNTLCTTLGDGTTELTIHISSLLWETKAENLSPRRSMGSSFPPCWWIPVQRLLFYPMISVKRSVFHSKEFRTLHTPLELAVLL